MLLVHALGLQVDRATVTFWLTIGGAITAYVLAALRAVEFFQDRRPRLTIVTSLTSDHEIGNTVTLLNASKVPANIWHFSLVWVKPGTLQKYFRIFRKAEREESRQLSA